jgi:2-methylcitrate dehydratase PrpD
VRDLQTEHGFSGPEVQAITVTGTERMVERHNILEPADLMLAQYSIPFCVALALYREARDPESFDENALHDPRIHALCRRVWLVPEAGGAYAGMGSTVTWHSPTAAISRAAPRMGCSNPASWKTSSSA